MALGDSEVVRLALLEAAGLEATTPELLTARTTQADAERPVIAEDLINELLEREVCEL